jgi:uncharacterized membrane protein YbhN (UPF0104 family)
MKPEHEYRPEDELTELSAGFERRQLIGRLVRLFLVAVVVVLVIVSVPGLGSLRARLARADPGWVVTAAVLEAASVMSFAMAFHRVFAGRLPRWSSASLAMTAQGVNVLVPAGGTGGLAAVTVVMARRGISDGFVIRRMVALFVITGVLTNIVLVIAGGFGVAAGVLPGHAPLAASLLPGCLALAVVAVVPWLLRRTRARAAEGASRWRVLIGAAMRQAREGLQWSGALLRSRDPLLVVGSVGFVLLDLSALSAAFRAVDSTGLPLGTMILAYTLGQIGSVISLPGTTEGGLIGVFALYGAPLTATASAILVYRAAQTLVPLALGLVGAVGVRRLFAEDVSPEVDGLALEGPAPPG